MYPSWFRIDSTANHGRQWQIKDRKKKVVKGSVFRVRSQVRFWSKKQNMTPWDMVN